MTHTVPDPIHDIIHELIYRQYKNSKNHSLLEEIQKDIDGSILVDKLEQIVITNLNDTLLKTKKSASKMPLLKEMLHKKVYGSKHWEELNKYCTNRLNDIEQLQKHKKYKQYFMHYPELRFKHTKQLLHVLQKLSKNKSMDKLFDHISLDVIISWVIEMCVCTIVNRYVNKTTILQKVIGEDLSKIFLDNLTHMNSRLTLMFKSWIKTNCNVSTSSVPNIQNDQEVGSLHNCFLLDVFTKTSEFVNDVVRYSICTMCIEQDPIKSLDKDSMSRRVWCMTGSKKIQMGRLYINKTGTTSSPMDDTNTKEDIRMSDHLYSHTRNTFSVYLVETLLKYNVPSYLIHKWTQEAIVQYGFVYDITLRKQIDLSSTNVPRHDNLPTFYRNVQRIQELYGDNIKRLHDTFDMKKYPELYGRVVYKKSNGDSFLFVIRSCDSTPFGILIQDMTTKEIKIYGPKDDITDLYINEFGVDRYLGDLSRSITDPMCRLRWFCNEVQFFSYDDIIFIQDKYNNKSNWLRGIVLFTSNNRVAVPVMKKQTDCKYELHLIRPHTFPLQEIDKLVLNMNKETTLQWFGSDGSKFDKHKYVISSY